MSRTIPAATQALLENDLGEEIVLVLEIFWGGESESVFYSDRDIPGAPYVKPAILTLPEIDAAVQVSQGGQSKSTTVVLDDTDGTIKALFDQNDFHKAPVQIWFYVMGTAFATEKFSVFKGQINSPVNWKEGDRDWTLSIVNRIEDVEVGFSAEEGEFDALPEGLIGKPWPLCFGTTINVPALKAIPSISGALAGGVGIKDFTLPARIKLAELITCPQTPIGFKCFTTGGGIAYNATCNIAYETDAGCVQAKCVELERLNVQLAEQTSYEFSSFTVFGGKNFPQGVTVTLNINGGLFTGFFDGTPANPSNLFRVRSRRHPLFDPATGGVLDDPVALAIESNCPGTADAQDSNFVDSAFGPLWTGYRNSRISWENYRRAKAANFFWATGGSTVTLENNREIIYIANIVPSTVLRVAAWRTLNGNRFLLTVPDEFFTVRQTDYGTYQVMEVVFQRPLSAEQRSTGGGWTDDIFITQTSSVGPNTVQIIKWIIETYTDYAIDSTSFDDVETKLENYPMHFPLLRRPGLLDILQELAQKARCALWQRDDTFFIKYLAEEPTPVATIVEDDVLQDDGGVGTLEIELTKTEDLVTKLTSEWQRDYSIPEPNTLILRANVKKYGTHARIDSYFPYAHLDLVRKSSTFWLIRAANTWKKIKLVVSLEYALLEPFDAVSVTLPDASSGTVVGVVERAVLDSRNKQINLEVWLPVRAGEMTSHVFAYPAYISENALFPSIEATNAGLAGSGNDPNFSAIAPPGHPLKVQQGAIFSGFSLGCNGVGVTSLTPGECRQDHGDKKPSDIGDKKPTVDVSADETGNVSGSSSPISNGAGTGPFSITQNLKDISVKNESDGGKAKEIGESGGSNSDTSAPTSGPVDENFLDNLPDPDELTDPCQITVTASGFPTTKAKGADACLPGAGFTDIYVFNSQAGAQQFCGGLASGSDCTKPPCGMCVGACNISGTCAPGTEGNGSMIGFRRGSSTNTIMLG